MPRPAMLMLAVIGLQLTGCVPPVIRKTATYRLEPSERDTALDRALAVCQAQGWIVAVSDRAAGLITSQTMQVSAVPCGFFSCPGRQTLQISVGRDGSVAVNLHEERFYRGLDASNAHWFIPQDQASVSRIEAAQRALLSEIVGRPIEAPPAPPTAEKRGE